jgi:hypothetical protein
MANVHKQWTGRAQARLAGEFRFSTQQVGTTTDGRVNLYYDPSLGQQGLDVANAILPRLDVLFANNDALFGVTGKAGNVILAALEGRTDGGSGAFHRGCAFNEDSPEASDWYEDIAFNDPDRTLGLVQAEVTESYMGLQGAGWDCGGSNGEALSRLLAELISGGPSGALRDYATGGAWAQGHYPNWIDATENTDTNPISTGCGVVFLWWLVSLGHSPTQIVQAGCPDGTLASNYKALTGRTTAWFDFATAVNALPNDVTGDDPWQSQLARFSEALPGGAVTLTIDPVAKTITIPAGYRVVTAGAARVLKPSGA